MAGFDVVAAVKTRYPQLITRGWEDLNNNGAIDNSEILKDANEDNDLDERDYYRFVCANSQYIAKEIRDNMIRGLTETGSSEGTFTYYAIIYSAQLGDKSNIPALGKIFANDDEDASLRSMAALALVVFGDKTAIPAAVKGLKSDDKDVKRHSRIAFQNFGNKMDKGVIPDFAPVLIQFLNGDDKKLRDVAALVLNRLEDKNVLPALILLLESTNPEIRLLVVRLVSKLGGVEGIPILKEVLRKETNEEVRLAAASALADWGDEEVETELSNLLNSSTLAIRVSAAGLLINKFGHSADKMTLIFAFALESEDVSLRRQAVFHLADIKNETVIPLLLKALKDPDLEVRTLAVIGVTGSGSNDPAILPALKEALKTAEENSSYLEMIALDAAVKRLEGDK